MDWVLLPAGREDLLVACFCRGLLLYQVFLLTSLPPLYCLHFKHSHRHSLGIFFTMVRLRNILKHVENRILSREIYVVIYEKGALIHRSRLELPWVHKIIALVRFRSTDFLLGITFQGTVHVDTTEESRTPRTFPIHSCQKVAMSTGLRESPMRGRSLIGWSTA